MKLCLSLFLSSVLVTPILAAQVVLPLYSAPGSSEWSGLESALGTYPDLEFIVIINPSNGPGSSLASDGSDWQSALATLNSYNNVMVLGYVYTNFTERAINDVKEDIATYACSFA